MWGAALAEVIGAGLGMAMEGHNDKRQQAQSRKLEDMKRASAKKMADYNKQIALEMWEKTGPVGQREQLEKAGLNPGLIYGMGGAGGQTTSTNSGQSQGGQAEGQTGEYGMGIQLGMQAAMQQAQIELLQAQTEKTEAETIKTSTIDTEEAQSRTGLNLANTSNTEANTILQNAQSKGQEITNNINQQGTQDTLRQIKANADITEQRMRSVKTEGDFNEATKESKIKQFKNGEAIQVLEIMQKDLENQNIAQDTKLKYQQIINGISQNIRMQNQTLNEQNALERDEQRLKLNKTDTEIKKALQEFNTSAPMQIRQYLGILTDLLGATKPTGSYTESYDDGQGGRTTQTRNTY